MSTIRQLSILLTASALAACNGSSGKNEEVTPPDPDAPTLVAVSVLDENCQPMTSPSLVAGSTFCIEAYLSKNNASVVNTSVSFETPLGSLSPSSKLTNSDGVAQVLLTSASSDIGAADVTASSQGASDSASFEFLRDTNQTTTLPVVSLSSFVGDAAINSAKQGEVITLKANLVDKENNPISNQPIRFTAEIGELNASSWLTDTNGNANVLLTLASDSPIGAATAVATYQLDESNSVSSQINYQVLSADDIETPVVQVGYFDNDGNFIANQLKLSVTRQSDGSVDLAAGGTLGLSLVLVDENEQVITTPTAVNFSSNCVLNSKASIDEQVLTINGEANSTYKDISCAGATGNQDQIITSVTVNGSNIILTQDINLSGEALGAIEFVSAEPNSIVLKGTGGVGRQEVSTITFRVKGKQSNLLAQQEVNFSASTNVGGLEVSPKTAVTNSQGEVSTKVISGTVPTPVRVTASAATTNDAGESVEIISQSDLLSVNTGLADQNSISLSAAVLNPESNSINGVTTEITAWLADSFNNPVPDGTTVNFTTEGGQIEPSCQTTNGSCSVTWQSSEPRVFNHRSTILATAIGHETFFDTNGNNLFDNQDGNPVVNNEVSSGFGRAQYLPSGFIDMSEAWRDDNENDQYDQGEIFIDFDNNKVFASDDGMFNGPQCSGDLCAAQSLINVRKSLVLIMASGVSKWALYEANNTETLIADNSNTLTPTAIKRASSQAYTLYFADTAMQTLPFNSTVSIATDEGELVGQTSFTVGNTTGTPNPISQADIDANVSISTARSKNVFGGQSISFDLKNTLAEDDQSATANLTIEITSPSGQTTFKLLKIQLL
ncbi:hypothetical protein [Pseudoalteromonas sp.]|uniref:hypothetical protein n=1 Tax=Pseudoalteromonas sp. TaxID=53249 RepID=UPI003562F1B3